MDIIQSQPTPQHVSTSFRFDVKTIVIVVLGFLVIRHLVKGSAKKKAEKDLQTIAQAGMISTPERINIVRNIIQDQLESKFTDIEPARLAEITLFLTPTANEVQ